jgi:hypothetical protein
MPRSTTARTYYVALAIANSEYDTPTLLGWYTSVASAKEHCISYYGHYASDSRLLRVPDGPQYVYYLYKRTYGRMLRFVSKVMIVPLMVPEIPDISASQTEINDTESV